MRFSVWMRRFSSEPWRTAHRHQLPDRKTALLWLLAALLVIGLANLGTLWKMKAEAKEAIDTTSRVVGCLNGQRTLGGYTEKDGSNWIILCKTYEVRQS